MITCKPDPVDIQLATGSITPEQDKDPDGDSASLDSDLEGAEEDVFKGSVLLEQKDREVVELDCSDPAEDDKRSKRYRPKVFSKSSLYFQWLTGLYSCFCGYW